MSVQTNKGVSRQQVSPAIVIVLVVALILFVVWRGWAAFSGPPQGKLPPPPTQDINFLMQKARECQGDFKKLSPEDQAKVQQISHGWGVATMVSDWRKISQQAH